MLDKIRDYIAWNIIWLTASFIASDRYYRYIYDVFEEGKSVIDKKEY